MSKTPTLRSRVLNLLGTARMLGRSGVTLAALAATLCASPQIVLASVAPDMLEPPTGAEAPPVHCGPGPTLVLR